MLEVPHDPNLWTDDMQELEAEGIPVAEFPQSWPRMAPACEDFRSAVIERRLSHDGDPALARHIGNAVTETSHHGTRIVKQGGKDSAHTIDLAVAAVMARARAVFYGYEPPEPELNIW